MFVASSWVRKTAGRLVGVLTMLFATAASAQTINLSLNVFYPTHTWELVAKSSNPGTTGIAGITVRLTDINSVVQLEGPRATVNGNDHAGFQLFDNPQPSFHELSVAQVPIDVTAGNEQGLFFGVGTLTNGAPNYPGHPGTAIGPAFTSLTGPQDIPWASTSDPFGDATWNVAAIMASGTFTVGERPAFTLSGNLGNVFTTTDVSPAHLGDQVPASTVIPIVRNVFSADYNHNGIVDAADFVVWRKQQGMTVPFGSGADGFVDGVVNQLDYDLWRSHIGNAFGAGSGAGSGAGLSSGTVPEPASGMLLAIGALLATAPRRARR